METVIELIGLKNIYMVAGMAPLTGIVVYYWTRKNREAAPETHKKG